jgi:nucleotide-binding universal stress UspA family protein
MQRWLRQPEETHVFKHILVPTDFGEPAQHALDIGIELARKFDAKLSILHSYQFIIPLPYTEAISFPFEQIALRAQELLDDTVVKASERYVKCTGLLRTGQPFAEIVDAARDGGVDLIVMGTHGRRGLPRAIMGSTAERVVRTSPVPVLTVSGRGEASR